VRVWTPIDRAGPALVFPGHSGPIRAVAWSRNGARLASASDDFTVRIWDVESGRVLHTLEGHTKWVYDVAFSPDGRLLASASEDSTVRVWEVDTGRPLRTMPGYGRWLYRVIFSPDGQRLASGSEEGFVKIWDVVTGQELGMYKGHRLGVYSLAFSGDGRWLATGGEDGDVRLRDARPLTPPIQQESEARTALAYLLALPLRRKDAAARLRADPSLSDPVRRQALAWLEQFPEERDPQAYARAAWRLLGTPYLKATRYDQALRQAEASCALSADPRPFLTLLGVAQYRAGQLPAAIATLTRAEKHLPGTPADLAFLAMAHHKTGEAGRAGEYLARLRAALALPRWSADEAARAFLREAEEMLR